MLFSSSFFPSSSFDLFPSVLLSLSFLLFLFFSILSPLFLPQMRLAISFHTFLAKVESLLTDLVCSRLSEFFAIARSAWSSNTNNNNGREYIQGVCVCVCVRSVWCGHV